MRNIWKISAFIAVLLVACVGPSRLSDYDMSDQYGDDKMGWDVQVDLLNLNDSISELFVVLGTEQLLFSKTVQNRYLAEYDITYQVFEDYDAQVPIDTATLHYSIYQDGKVPPVRKHRIKFEAPSGKDYILKIVVQDQNRGNSATFYEKLEKSSLGASHWWWIEKAGVDSFKFIGPEDALMESKEIWLTQYKIKPQPAPYAFDPFGTFDLGLERDTGFYISQEHSKVALKENQMLFFQLDSLQEIGKTICEFSKTFPKVESKAQLYGPLAYIMEAREYERFQNQTNQLEAFEHFWMRSAGGRERARKAMKEYYASVEKANQLFSTYLPGWATDMGMIYIIYGSPNIVYRYNNHETWLYGDENNLYSEVFTFRRVQNPFSTKVYRLERNVNYRISYNRMVKLIKEGRIGY